MLCIIHSAAFLITHAIKDQLIQNGITGDYLIQGPAQSRLRQSRLPEAVSSQVLNISKDGDSTV